MFLLIATDDENVAKTLKSLLESEKTSAHIAKDAESAVKALDSGEVDVLIVETKGYFGFPAIKLAETAKYLRSTTRVILINNQSERISNDCFDAYFEIPIDVNEFEKKIAQFRTGMFIS